MNDKVKLVLLSIQIVMIAGCFLFGGVMAAVAAEPLAADYSKLRRLNDRYVESFLKSDVEWYRQILADDFTCIDSDGSVLNKAQFLEQTAKGPGIPQYSLEQVQVRIYGDAALVQATGHFIRNDGTSGRSRYTDVYVRKGSDWKVV